MSPSTRTQIIVRWYDSLPEDIVPIMDNAKGRDLLTDALRDHLSPDFDGGLYGPAGAGFEETFEGVDGLVEAWKEWTAPWARYRAEYERVMEGPNAVLVDALQLCTPHGATGEVESRAAAVWYFEGDLITRVEFHLDRERAMAAAGISEP